MNKNHLTAILALLPILGISFMLFSNAEKKVPPPALGKNQDTESLHKASQLPSDAGLTSKAEKKRRFEAMKLANEAEDKETDRIIAETVSKFSESTVRKMNEREMSRRQPRYEKLFDAWSLGADVQSKVLQIIQSREEAVTLMLLGAAKKGGDSSVSALSEIFAERESSRTALMAILGAEKFQEFLRVDNELNGPILPKLPRPD